MAPTIRTCCTYSTHKEYSIDVFGDALFVTVTPDFSIISQWIRDVVRNNCGPYYSQPLVVGVGVQWTPPVCYDANPPPNIYYSDHPPRSYYANPPLSDYYADPPQNNYSANPSRASYYVDPSPGDYISDTQRGDFNSDPPADTLQLCVGNRCLIIQLGHCDQVPNSLRNFLADPETTFVGVWNSQDAGKLARSNHQLEIGKIYDIRQHVNDSQGRSMRGCSFEEIVAECMGYQGVRLDPAISMSDWSVYNLDREQVLQASIDAHVCYRLGVLARLWEV